MQKIIKKEQTSKNNSQKRDDLCLIIVGMAGSGKTTFTANFKNHLMEKPDIGVYASNLDPVVLETPYSCEYDIRKDFEHAEIMKKYKLGPNGAIMTCLNMFCAQIDKFVERIQEAREMSCEGEQEIDNESESEEKESKEEKNEEKTESKNENKEKEGESKNEGGNDGLEKKVGCVKNLFLVDTPGQIEAFMWSASGEIITKTLAATMPTAMCFILDR